MEDKDLSLETKAGYEKKDLTNKLPDYVISYILTFSKLKDAADTCSISHRWRHLWKHLILRTRNLEFDVPNIFGGKYPQLVSHDDILLRQIKRKEFVRRVQEFLRVYSGKKVDSFKVVFPLNGKYAADLDEWIRFALEKGAELIDLHIPYTSSVGADNIYIENRYDFPPQLLLSNSSLKHLSLRECGLKRFNRLYQLTTLELRRVKLDENFTACLFPNCLFLERLTLLNCCELGSVLKITAPRLTDLKVIWCYGLKKMEIYAANLVSLEYDSYEVNLSCIKTPRLEILIDGS